MCTTVLLTLLFSSILTSINWAIPDCGNEVILFTSQPRDVELFEEVHNVARFPCNYEGEHSIQTHLQWIINSTVYDLQLPPYHQYLRSINTLSVTNIKHWQNGTTYRCQVLVTFDKGQQCASQSSIGRLIIKGFEVHTTPHYYTDSKKQEIMTEIFISFSQVDSRASYDLIFTNLATDKVCNSDVIPASSCVDGACDYVFKVPASSCPINTDILITVGVSSSEFSKQIKIDSVNKFIKVIFHEATSSLALKFINQPKESEKHYTVRYGALDPSCRHLAVHTKGHLTNSNSITVELNIRPENTTITEFCLSVTVTNGSTTVSVEEIYSFGSHFSNHTIMALVFVLIAILIVIVSLIFTVMLYRHFAGQLSKYQESGRVNYVKNSEQNPVILEPIDLSTTYYKLLTVTKEYSIYEFGKKHFPDYQPHRGFGYYKLTDDKGQLYKRVIVMSNDIPIYTIVSLAAKQRIKITTSNIYVQEKESRTLHPHDKFLYCARSKEITKIAYWKVFDVTQECKESSFIEEKFSGYSTDWICYGYFELTKPTNIEATQSFVILKKNSSLVKGPGVQHLLTAGTQQDNSTIVQPPNLEVDHPEWQHIFVQSTDGERQLIPGTKYLFCAMMDRIDDSVHRAIHVVDKQCTMEEFGRRFNPVFKAELGYGYFELVHREYLKLHKNVIIMDKEGRLFTGAGAKFFYINCQYGKEEIENKKEIAPPDLEGTEWNHVFVQSHNKDRILRKGTRFLYCEYRTIEQL